jgi:hypothetical protein
MPAAVCTLSSLLLSPCVQRQEGSSADLVMIAGITGAVVPAQNSQANKRVRDAPGISNPKQTTRLGWRIEPRERLN